MVEVLEPGKGKLVCCDEEMELIEYEPLID